MNSEQDNKQGAQGKHTPGPWRIGNTTNGHASSVQAPSVATYSHTAGREMPMTICSMAARSRDHYAEMDANAALIAAAPDLLAACEAARRNILDYLNGEWDGNVEGWEAVMARCNAAIRKAQGQ